MSSDFSPMVWFRELNLESDSGPKNNPIKFSSLGTTPTSPVKRPYTFSFLQNILLVLTYTFLAVFNMLFKSSSYQQRVFLALVALWWPMPRSVLYNIFKNLVSSKVSSIRVWLVKFVEREGVRW